MSESGKGIVAVLFNLLGIWGIIFPLATELA